MLLPRHHGERRLSLRHWLLSPHCYHRHTPRHYAGWRALQMACVIVILRWRILLMTGLSLRRQEGDTRINIRNRSSHALAPRCDDEHWQTPLRCLVTVIAFGDWLMMNITICRHRHYYVTTGLRLLTFIVWHCYDTQDITPQFVCCCFATAQWLLVTLTRRIRTYQAVLNGH